MGRLTVLVIRLIMGNDNGLYGKIFEHLAENISNENMNTLSKMGIAPAPEYDEKGLPNPDAGERGCCGKFFFSLCFCLTGCCFGCFCCCFCFYGMCCGCCCGKCAPKAKIPVKSEKPI